MTFLTHEFETVKHDMLHAVKMGYLAIEIRIVVFFSNEVFKTKQTKAYAAHFLDSTSHID